MAEMVESHVLLTPKIRRWTSTVLNSDALSGNVKAELKTYTNVQPDASGDKPQIIPFRLVKELHRCLQEETGCLYLHELLEGSNVYLPKYEPPPRDPELDKRIQRLKNEQSEREYKQMTKNVDFREINEPAFGSINKDESDFGQIVDETRDGSAAAGLEEVRDGEEEKRNEPEKSGEEEDEEGGASLHGSSEEREERLLINADTCISEIGPGQDESVSDPSEICHRKSIELAKEALVQPPCQQEELASPSEDHKVPDDESDLTEQANITVASFSHSSREGEIGPPTSTMIAPAAPQPEVKQINRQIMSVFNFLLTVIGAFTFGYKCVEYTVATPNLTAQMASGLIFATIVFFADLYFLVKFDM